VDSEKITELHLITLPLVQILEGMLTPKSYPLVSNRGQPVPLNIDPLCEPWRIHFVL